MHDFRILHYATMRNLHVRVFSQTHDKHQHEIKDETSTYSRRHEQKSPRSIFSSFIFANAIRSWWNVIYLNSLEKARIRKISRWQIRHSISNIYCGTNWPRSHLQSDYFWHSSNAVLKL